MQVNITIIPEGRQATTGQFATLEAARDYLEIVSTKKKEYEVTEDWRVDELSPTPSKRGFFKRLFNIR